MEDPFAAGAPATDEDPFAEAEAGGVATETEASTAEDLPIVDKEGERVDPAVEEARKAAEEARGAAQEYADAAPTTDVPPEPPADAPAPPDPEDAAPKDEPEPEPEPAEADAKERRYKLLYQTGPNQWAEATLDDVPQGIRVEVADGEKWLMARNADHARRLAFALFGRPEAGVTVVPVAGSSWRPRRVRTKAPEPSRERLEIV